MPMKIRFFLIFLFLVFCSVKGQTDFSVPLNKINITGNYGEIRPNHFHAGIDFSTEGEENLPIFAVSKGFVSRIKVSSYGYGKVLYITHPDGKLSVYAHQNKFADKIEVVVKAEQLKKQSYEIELFPAQNEIMINAGEIIGFSGNTGGSTGPHLHFEIRNELTEIPVNPLLLFKFTDTVKPMINAVSVYDLSDELNPQATVSVKVKGKRDSLFCGNDSIVLKHSSLGFAFSGYDQAIHNGNPNNIYEVQLYFDSLLIYHHQLNYITFDNARYVNVFSDRTKSDIWQKCFVPKVFPGDLYKTLVNRGQIELKDTLFHAVKFVMKDEQGLGSELKLYCRTNKFRAGRVYMKDKFYVDCEKDFSYKGKNFEFSIPAKSIFNDVAITKINDQLNSVYIDATGPEFRTHGVMRIKVPKNYLNHAQKIIILNNNSTIIPKINNDLAEFNFKSLGSFRCLVDTVGPKIKTKVPLKKLKTKFKFADHIAFIITDALSGIESYKLFINDQWYLAEYDAKSDRLTYVFDPESPTGEMNFRVEVKDRVGNSSVYNLKLKR
jgi:hypothetical protein